MTAALEALKKMPLPSMNEALKGFIEGNTYQESLSIPDEAMQEYYEIACEFYDNKQFEEAGDVFFFLACLNPLQSNLWIRSGNAEEALEHYEEALEAYSMAMLTDSNDPFPHYYSAGIYLKIGSKAQAKECLDICLRLVEDQPEFQPLKTPIKKLQEKVHEAI